MSPLVPRQRSHRVSSALLGAALTTGLVAVTASADSARQSPATEAADVPDPEDEGSATADPDDARAGGSAGRERPATARPSPDSPTARLAHELQPLAEEPVELAVVVLEPETGARVEYGTGVFETASVVKTNVVAALLLQAQEEDRGLTVEERKLAGDAVRQSDNDATHELWARIGRAPGLRAANDQLGLAETVTGTDGRWGLTRTTAADQIILLKRIFGDTSPLTSDSRAYLAGLMDMVTEEQSWGVSAAVPGARTALKNGWLPRSTTERWHINSVGRVTATDREYLVAVLSTGHTTREDGIAVVETAAKAAVDVLRADRPPRA